jgi:IS605 OrfB family transposase
MKIIRSSRHSIKFTTSHKREVLFNFIEEYSKVVNLFIDIFWEKQIPKREINKPIIDLTKNQTWITYRARKVASYEAIGMVLSELNKEKLVYTKPHHNGKRIHAYEDIAKIEFSKNSKHFDCWVHLHSIGKKISLDIPIKLHRHFHKLVAKGRLMTSCIISKKDIQLCFGIITEPKKELNKIIALDTGMNNLLVSNEGQFFGKNFISKIKNIVRKQKGSKNQQSARKATKHYIDEVVKEVINSGCDLIIMERLKNITKGKKGKNFNKLLNNWYVSYLQNRLKQKCEENRVSYRCLSAYNTSRTCPNCGCVDAKNREREDFKCLKCGFSGHADYVGAINLFNNYFLNLGKFPSPKV